MLRMSRAGLADRWTLFTGALLSVALGVALVQSSLLLLITAATMDPPAGLGAAARMGFEDNTTAAVAMLGVVLGTSVFLAAFIISSTFAFTVDQRRRDLALLRLAGGSRGQVRRLLLGEAVLLGLLGTAIGVPGGLGVMAAQAWLMRTLGFVPDGFRGEWRMWILGVSAGVGLLLAVAGVLTAARRAARVRPLEALREIGPAARVMTAGRWIAGAIFFGGALALIIVAPHGGPAGGQAMAMNVAMPAAVAAAALSPLLVPLLAGLVPPGGSVVAGLARANVRDARRRSASVAAPLIVLVALVVGNATAGTSFAAAGIAETRRDIHADLVVTATGPVGPAVEAVPGVALASTETSIPASATVGRGEEAETEAITALVIDPAAYTAVHGGSTAAARAAGSSGSVGAGSAAGPSGSVGADSAAGPSGSVGADSAAGPSGSVGAGSAAGSSGSVGAGDPAGSSGPAAGGSAVPGEGPLGALRGRAVAAGPGGEVPSKGTVRLVLPGVDLGDVPVVAAVPETMSGGANLLLPAGLVPAEVLASAPTNVFVRLAPGADPAATRAALERVGTVSGVPEWLRADADARTATSNKIMLVVMGLGGLYALLGVINSVVIGAATRRREFAEARVTGLTRGQVIRSALTETFAVTVAGLALGALAAGAAFLAVLTTTSAVTGVATLDVPWLLVAGVTGVAVLVTSVTSLLTSWSATRPAPVHLLAARE